MTPAPASGSPLLITDFLYRARDLFAAKTITQYQDGEKIFSYTYAEYADRVLRLAQALIDLGVRPGDRVATLAWNHHRHLELYLAAPLAGAVLHTLNLRLAADEIAYIVDHADDRVVFVDSSLLPLLDSVRSRRPEMPVITTDGDSPNHDELIAAATPLEKPVPRDENDLAALCYTSGTTGAPRASATRTARSTCTPSPHAWPTATRSASATPSATSSRCSTPTRGASRSPR